MDMLSRLAVFAAVIDHQGFTHAASALGLTRSSVSKHIARLEEELSVQLIERTTRSMALTEIGEQVYQRAKQVSDMVAETQALVADYRAEVAGRLRIIAATGFGALYVEPAVAVFSARFPEVSVSLSLDDGYADPIKDGFDVVVRVAHLEAPSCASLELAENHMALIASPSYLARHGAPETMAGLRDHNCIVFENENGAINQWPVLEGPVRRTVRVRGNLILNDERAIVRAVRAGVGIGFVPRYHLTDEPDLVEVLPHVRLPPFSVIRAFYPATGEPPPKTKAFLDILIEQIGNPPRWLTGGDG